MGREFEPLRTGQTFTYIMTKFELATNLAALTLLIENNELNEELMSRVRVVVAKIGDYTGEDVSAEQIVDHILTNLGG